ncbi:MAG TPA: hypothetical protein PKH07_19395, partial [bacterium]|nr:hypothetical protein [bacterium]
PGEAPRVHGPMRLAKLAHFLLREIFPAHDTLCKTEGDLMMAFYQGDKTAASQLAQLQGQTKDYMDRVWGSEEK